MLSLLTPILSFLLPILSVFLILLILVQRGRGGGLVGAFGGSGGQSAFGARAGDVFTRVTVVVVCIWIIACILLLLGMRQGGDVQRKGFDNDKPASVAPAGSSAPVTIPLPASPEN